MSPFEAARKLLDSGSTNMKLGDQIDLVFQVPPPPPPPPAPNSAPFLCLVHPEGDKAVLRQAAPARSGLAVAAMHVACHRRLARHRIWHRAVAACAPASDETF